jgi:Zn-dependent protease with chaperone function
MFSQAIMSLLGSLFPKVKIAFKDQTPWMSWLCKLLWFDPTFATEYTTTVGNTVYFPSKHFIDVHPITSIVILCHELTHISDEQRYNPVLFGLLYLLPQILVIPCIFLFWLISWKFVLPLMLLCLLPWPAYFRTLFERRAYSVSLYAMNRLNQKGYNIDLQAQKQSFLDYFTGSDYYWMGKFLPVEKDLDAALITIQSGNKPFESDVFSKVDQLIDAI